MENEEKLKGFENVFKDKLNELSPQYNSNDWIKLKKDLKAKGISSASYNINYFIAIASISIIAITTYLFFNNITQIKSITEKCNIVKKENISETNNDIILINSINEEKHNCINQNNEKTTNYKKQVFTENNVIENKENVLLTYKESKPPIEAKNIIKKPTIEPNADFTFDIVEGCTPLKVKFIPIVKSDSMIYLWSFGDGKKSTKMIAENTFENSGEFYVSLTVKYFKAEAVITNISSIPIIVKQSAQADLYIENDSHDFNFRNNSTYYDRIEWRFGDGKTSILENTNHIYNVDGNYNLQLIAFNNNGCNDTLNKQIKVDIIHKYEMPNAFIPNGDGKNEIFGPIGEELDKYKIEMYIYNKFGHLIFESRDSDFRWNGKIKGTNKLAEEGVYVWVIISKDKFGNIKKNQGNVTLINKQ